MRASATLFHKNASSTYHKYACGGIFIHALHLPRLFAKGFLPHTAVTGYGGVLFFNNKEYTCLQASMLYLTIFITLPVAIIFPSHKRKELLIVNLLRATVERINFICIT